MKILLIGNKGPTGRRYEKILLERGHSVSGYDIPEYGQRMPDLDRCLIASPTPTHIHYATLMQDRGTPYLVEKPACSDPYDVDKMTGHMVNNWAFVFNNNQLIPGENKVFYRNGYTGKEGFWFDTCQLHILSDGFSSSIIKRPGNFEARINDCPVTLNMIERSYERMIDSWLSDDGRVWRIPDIAEPLKKILRKAQVCPTL